MKHKRRRAFTLLEVLISIGLTAIILSTLSYFFYEMTAIGKATDRIRQKAFSLRNLENRLNDIVPKAISANDPAGDFIYFTSLGIDNLYVPGSQTLTFTFDNCVNPVEASFSNHVLGKIFLDKEKNLTLMLWPSPVRWEENKPTPSIREVLYTNVEALSFQFFVPPERKRDPLNKKKTLQQASQAKQGPEPRGAWLSEWREDYGELPALVKMYIKIRTAEGTENRTMVFPLVQNDQYIVYEK